MQILSESRVTPKSAPRRLFKYLHPDRIDVLETCKICFSSPLNLNDPFELKPPLRLYDSDESMWAAAESLLPQLIEETVAEIPLALRHLVTKANLEAAVRIQMRSKDSGYASTLKSLMPALHARFNAEMEKLVGILCLTEAPDDILMWAHYACSHEGFVVEFDPEASFFSQKRSEKDEFRHLRPVHYSNIRPLLTFDNADFSAMLTKSEHWSYEREWRMMVALPDASSVLTVGGKDFHLFAFPPSIIKSVILGSRMSQENSERLVSLISESPLLAHVICYQATTDDRLFKLNINPITD